MLTIVLMKSFLYLILSIVNSLLVPNQLILFLVIFHFTKQITETKKVRLLIFTNLTKKVLNALSNSKPVIIVSNTSIKNNVIMSIIHTHLFSNPINKTIHHAAGIISMEAKLFAIRCNIIQIQGFSYIVIITDTIHIAY